jgi:uncharacterized protein (TIGR03067 family)
MRVLLLFSVLAIGVPDRPDPSAKENRPIAEDLLGEWQVTKRVTHGNDSPNLPVLHMLFKRDAMQHLLNGTQPATTFPYKLDAMKNPATISFQPGNETGILKIEGDVLTICLDKENRFPAEFISPVNSKITLVQLKRVKK